MTTTFLLSDFTGAPRRELDLHNRAGFAVSGQPEECVQRPYSGGGTPGYVIRGDALFSELHARGCCGSPGLHTEPLGGCDWTGHGLGLTDVCPRGNVFGEEINMSYWRTGEGGGGECQCSEHTSEDLCSWISMQNRAERASHVQTFVCD